MKLRRIVTLACTSVVIFGLCATTSAKAATKIAYVNLEKIFDEYQKTKDFDSVLEKESKEKQAEREKMVEKIRKLKDELDLMNKDAKEKKQGSLDQKIKELQEFDREVNKELKQKRDSMFIEIMKEIDVTIKEYGQKEKFNLIVDDRALLYRDDSLNITNQILKILDERYKRNR